MNIIQTLDIDIKYIIHLADIHIRNVKRHIEYQSVFNKLYEKILELTSTHQNCAIYLGGDIVHAKLDMSPELVSMTYSFFKKCADIAPTFLILGNHDCNLNNKNRMDALSPIVNTLSHPNLHFLKDTGIYRTNNIDFIVWSILDDPALYVIPEESSKNKKILLYHGAVDKSVTEQGIIIQNNKVSTAMMKGVDYAMLGDIHKYQYLDENKTICYCGSLIQQNFGESLDHGFVFWNLNTGFSKFVNIHNDYSFYTLEVKNGKWVDNTLPSSFCKYPTVRIKAYDTLQSDITKLAASLKSAINVEDIKIQKMSSKIDTNKAHTRKTGDIRDIDYQNTLIQNFLEKNIILDSNLKNEIFTINRNINSNIDISSTIKNINWIPKKFEFSNMFSYGEDNSIDFESMRGLYGLFASNAAGKSSILDALTFCIFDKCSRTFKAGQVLNNKKDSFYCKFTFEIHGKHFFIERIGIKDKKNHVKVEVNFWSVDGDNVTILNGEDRDDTNAIIREYLGNYDEFVLTSMSLQNNSSNFLDKAQRERKDLLSQFLDLNIFDELTQQANQEINQLKAALKLIIKEDHPTKISEALAKKQEIESQLKKIKQSKLKTSNDINEITNKILELTKNQTPIDSAMYTINDTNLNEEILKIQEQLDQNLKTRINKNECTNELIYKKNEILAKINNFNIDQIEKNINKYTELTHTLKTLTDKQYKLKMDLDHNVAIANKLETHQYDPECQYCVNNEFVRDATMAAERVSDLSNQLNTINIAINSTNTEIQILEKFNTQQAEILRLNSELTSIETNILQLQNEIQALDILELTLQNNLNSKTELISKYHINREQIIKNKEIDTKIDELQIKKEQLSLELTQTDLHLADLHATYVLYDNNLNASRAAIAEMEKIEYKYKAYELYIKATNRNGIPYDLISEVVPQLENEANEILSQIVDFKLSLDTDGKSINIYIIYDDDKVWALELASGMERFISSLAIRAAILNYSNLPRPNFIAIDEGFGVLDSENLNSLYNIFNFLKNEYQFILIISHIDSLKDMVDHRLEIYKKDGFSKVIF